MEFSTNLVSLFDVKNFTENISYHVRLVIAKSNSKVSCCRTNVLQATPFTRGQINNVFGITRKSRSYLVTLVCLKTQKSQVAITSLPW